MSGSRNGADLALEGKRILVTGGTGSLGKTLIWRMLSGEWGNPAKIIAFSRDEAKQHDLRLSYLHRRIVTDEIVYRNFQRTLQFWIGDVRNYSDVVSAAKQVDIVFNAAALKQVPNCEYFPMQALMTNCLGAENIVRAIREHDLPIETVVGISTDKACKPINVMGMTKALQERIFIAANVHSVRTRFVCVRYGNVLASRGSVVPLFHEQIRNGGPVTVTDPNMTRFLLSLDDAVDTVMAAVVSARPGEIYVPDPPSVTMHNLARALVGNRPIEIRIVGVRPGEKHHEIMVSTEEAPHTVRRGAYLVIRPLLPELLDHADIPAPALADEFSSNSAPLSLAATHALLARHHLLVEPSQPAAEKELLR